MSSDDPPGVFLNQVAQIIVQSRVPKNSEDEVYIQDYGGIKLEHRKSVAIAVRNAVKLGVDEGGGVGGMSEITIEIYLRNEGNLTLVEHWYCGCSRHVAKRWRKIPVLYRALFARLRVLPLYWELKTKRRMNLDFTYKVFPGIPKKLLVGQARVINSDDLHLAAAYVEDVDALIARLLGAGAGATSMHKSVPTNYARGQPPRASAGVAIPGARGDGSMRDSRSHGEPDWAGSFQEDSHGGREYSSSYGGLGGRERSRTMVEMGPPVEDRRRSNSFGREYRDGGSSRRDRNVMDGSSSRPSDAPNDLRRSHNDLSEGSFRGRVQSMPADYAKPEREPHRSDGPHSPRDRGDTGSSPYGEGSPHSRQARAQGASLQTPPHHGRSSTEHGHSQSISAPHTRRSSDHSPKSKHSTPHSLPHSRTSSDHGQGSGSPAQGKSSGSAPASPDTRRRAIAPRTSGNEYRAAAGPVAELEASASDGHSDGRRGSPLHAEYAQDDQRRSSRASQPVNIPYRDGTSGADVASPRGVKSSGGYPRYGTPPYSARSGPGRSGPSSRVGSLPSGRRSYDASAGSYGSHGSYNDWLPFGGNSPSERTQAHHNSPGSYGSSLRMSYSAEHASPGGLRNTANLSDSRVTVYSEDDDASVDSCDEGSAPFVSAGPPHGREFHDELPFAMDDNDELDSYAQKLTVTPRLNMFASRRQDITESIHALDQDLHDSRADRNMFSQVTEFEKRN